MKISSSPTRDRFPLGHQKIIKKTIESTIGYAIMFVVLWGVIRYLGRDVSSISNMLQEMGLIWYALIVLVILFVISYLYQRWYFAVYFYDLTSDFIQIRKNPITPREITIPYERIQDVYVDQDIFDRIFGLYDVHISSATAASGMEAHIDGLEKQAAEGLRAVLLQTVKERISRQRTSAPAASAI